MSEQQRRIFEFVKEHPDTDGIDIGIALDIPLLECYEDLNEMVRKGFLYRNENVVPKTVRVK